MRTLLESGARQWRKLTSRTPETATARRYLLGNEAGCAGLVGAANELTEEEWIQLTPPLGDYPHARGIQRVDRKAVEAMANHFNSLRARLSRRFGGVPFYVGHPEVDKNADRKAYGWIEEVKAKEDGLYGRVKWSEPGKQLLANGHFKFFSPYWGATEVVEGGKRVLRPVELWSVGLTNQPNLPVNPLANEEAEEKENMNLLATLVALLGLANDAGEPVVIQRVTELRDADAAARTAAAEKQTALEALQNEKTAHGATRTALENEVSRLRAALENERKERASLLVDQAVREGRVSEASRAKWVEDLCANFEEKKTALANEKPKLPTESRTRGMGGRRGVDLEALANEEERRAKVLALVNEKMAKGLSYEQAFAAVRAENKELFAQMTQPGE